MIVSRLTGLLQDLLAMSLFTMIGAIENGLLSLSMIGYARWRGKG